MRSRAMNFMMTVTAAVALLAASGASAAEDAERGMTLSAPVALSVQGGNRIHWRAEALPGVSLPVHFELLSCDDQVVVPVFDGKAVPASGSVEASFEVAPEHLSAFALGERVLLEGRVGPWRTSGEFEVVAAAPVPEASGWTLNVPATAVVYSTMDSGLTFRTVSPKSKPVSVNLKLKFRNLKGKIVANWTYPVIALPGESVHTVTVPLSVCNQAKLKGANSLKTVILKNGDTKAQGQSLLDWDLVVSTSSDKTQGTSPLNVSFTALVSGGNAPYVFDWDFGDGTSHGNTQNPNHLFVGNGIFTVVLRVVDSRGGIVTAAPLTIAVQ